jgi:hypothetical protein
MKFGIDNSSWLDGPESGRGVRERRPRARQGIIRQRVELTPSPRLRGEGPGEGQATE